MSEAPVRELVRELLQKRGVETPWDEVLMALRAQARSCSQDVYYAEKRRLKQERDDAVKVQAVQETRRPDQLSDFIAFACAVERVGGITRAKAMLAHLETLYQIQNPEPAP